MTTSDQAPTGRTTREAAAELTRRLGRIIRPSLLQSAVYNSRLPEPGRGPVGEFVWTEQDLANARLALTSDRRRKRSGREPEPAAVG